MNRDWWQNAPAPVNVTDQDYRYNGKELETQYGLDWYFYGARMYDPAVGRFTGVDPLADAQLNVGTSTYAYVWNNPLIFIDPDGRHGQWIDNGDGTWTAEEGDSAATLAEDAGITEYQANAIIEEQFGGNRVAGEMEFSNVDPGDVVDVEGQFDIWTNDIAANHSTTLLVERQKVTIAEAMMAIFDPEIVGTILLLAEGTGGSRGPKRFNPSLPGYKASAQSGFTFTNSAAKHFDDIVTKNGWVNGKAARPYMNSPLTIQEIMATGKGLPDATAKGALNFRVPGAFRGSNGTWELVVDPVKKHVYHFNFVN